MKTGQKTVWLGVDCEKRKPTKKHQPAIWENLLGTVWAMSPEGEVRYFDYDHKSARKFCGVIDWRGVQVEPDVRLWKYSGDRNMGNEYHRPHVGQLVLWRLKGD